ncbi:MAG TPA: hypothetical protein VF773_15255 [Verrucomicrobiae bacterium]
MNTKSLLLGGFCFLCVIMAAGFYARKAELEREQAAMRAEIEALAQTAAAARAQQPTDDEPYQRLTQNERMELMRLRNEVTQLRATASAARDALKAALQNRPIPETHLTHHVVQPTEVAANGEPTRQEAESYDPLAFYRKNPELMKRYFPHLVNGNSQQPSESPADQAPLPPDSPQ